MQKNRILNTHYISIGDFIDLYFKIRSRGMSIIKDKLRFSKNKRAIAKWNEEETESNYWDIPGIEKRWNLKATGNADLGYEAYFCNNYLNDRRELDLLSIGCGTGTRERNFAVLPNFNSIEGIDFAKKQIEEAETLARKNHLTHIHYHTGDFLNCKLNQEKYDVILFNSSLHHFNHIESLLSNNVIPLLKKDGHLVIFD